MMGICLGNLSVRQIEDRLSIELSEDDRGALSASRQQMAENIAPGKWHCFDLPFVVVCGDMDTAIKVRDILTPYADKMSGQIQISIDGGK